MIHVEKINEVYMRVYSEDMGIEADLCDFFTYEVPGARYMPKYKARIWDGKIRLLDPIRRTLYIGLLGYVIKFAESVGCECKIDPNILPPPSAISQEAIQQYVNSLNLQTSSGPIVTRDYQLDAVHHAVNSDRCILLSPTGSGKSLIIYNYCRWHLDRYRKCLVVVPTTSLVEQMYSDFREYSTQNGFDVEENCQKLYGGFPKTFSRNILFTTWQSIYKQPASWFNQFDVVVGDEAHQFKAKSLTTIMEKLTDVQYRIGTTGSLDNKQVHKLVLEGLFGPVYRVAKTTELQEKGYLAPLSIKGVILKYDDDTRKALKKTKYQNELDYVLSYPKRTHLVSKLALSTTGNTLVLFRYVDKHGKPLFEKIKQLAKDRNVYFVHGKTSTDTREEIRKLLNVETNAILVASVGTLSTGINIPSIANLIFAAPSKSQIRVLQSIGRGLRINNNKERCTVYDVIDDLRWKSSDNFLYKHAQERFKIYAREGFPLKVSEVNI